MMKRQIKSQGAFTMIELLVVATVIILLTAIGLVSFSQVAISSRNAKRKADLETMRQALTLYKQDYTYYAETSSVDFASLADDLYAEEYLSQAVLNDPKNVNPYIYQAICSGMSGPNCVKVTLRAVLEPDEETYDLIAL
jgi:type II secretory pathway pseudopilin PulG